MNVYTLIGSVTAALLLLVSSFFYGCHVGSTNTELEYANKKNEGWSKAFVLDAQLRTRDIQLASEQAKNRELRQAAASATGRKYHEEVSKPAVRDCIRDSGLLNHYNATIGKSKR